LLLYLFILYYYLQKSYIILIFIYSVQEELNINNANSPAVNIYDESNDEDEFYIQPNPEIEYRAYLREPVVNKKVLFSFYYVIIIFCLF